jgi:hypothetical protein
MGGVKPGTGPRLSSNAPPEPTRSIMALIAAASSFNRCVDSISIQSLSSKPVDDRTAIPWRLRDATNP